MENREVINLVTRIRDRLMTTNSKQYEALTIAIATLEKQDQDRWHSVAKEGNPKENGFYLWTSKDGTVREDYYQVRDDTWSKAWQFGYEVIAWKPLPEPYTEEENDKP